MVVIFSRKLLLLLLILLLGSCGLVGSKPVKGEYNVAYDMYRSYCTRQSIEPFRKKHSIIAVVISSDATTVKNQENANILSPLTSSICVFTVKSHQACDNAYVVIVCYAPHIFTCSTEYVYLSRFRCG